MAEKRTRIRRNFDKIKCECGCGFNIYKFGLDNKKRRFASGHNIKTRKRKPIILKDPEWDFLYKAWPLSTENNQFSNN